MISEPFLRDNYEKLEEERLWEIIQKNIKEIEKKAFTGVGWLITTGLAFLAYFFAAFTIPSLPGQEGVRQIGTAALILAFIAIARTVMQFRDNQAKMQEDQLRLFFELKEKLDNQKKAKP